MKASLLQLIAILATIYVLFGLLLFLRQKSMIYYPDGQDFESCAGFSDYEKITYKGTRFYFKEKGRSAIVYYHGNAGSACDRSAIKSVFEDTDSSLIFVEYAGYSGGEKMPSQKLILEDVENVHDFVEKRGFKNNAVYGQSIGSGAASYHASLGNVDKLILSSSFSNLNEVAQSKYLLYPAKLLLREKYNNLGWLENFKGRILLVHGDSDLIIPHRFSQKLFSQLSTEKKEYVLIPKKGHNDLWSSPLYADKIAEFLASDS